MKLKTMIIMLLCATCMYAQDLSSGLSVVNDLSNYPMQPISKPGYLQTITDPSFGTTIRRISNAPQGGIIKPMYSTIQAWNADESLMVLFERGRGHQLLDGMTYQFIRYLDDVRPDDIEQIFWDFDDPDIFYYVDRSNNNFVRYSVSNASGEVIVNLGTLVNCPNVSLGNDVQMMSWDSDIVGFRCGNDRVYYYRISTGQLTEFNLFDDNVRYTAPMPGASGNYFYHNRRIYNSSGNLHTNLNESNIEHSCNGRLANGDDGYFAVSFAQGPNGGCLGNLIQHNMRTGECTPLISQGQGYPYSKSGTHVSAIAHKNTQGGWVAASMVGFEEDGQSLLDQELVLARMDEQGNVTVCRVGHHRSDEDQFDYWGEPHVSISPTGTRLVFASDWSGAEDGQSVDTYVVELPAYQQDLLPIALVDFTAKENNRKVYLDWSTATETNNAHFIVEHFAGNTSFKSIGRIAGNGTTNTPQNYQFTDHSPKYGVNYYRLKQVDTDGKFTYSNVISILIQKFDNEIFIQPNPVKDIAKIILNSTNEAPVNFTLTDAYGRIVATHIFSIQKGINTLEWEVSTLASGMYFLRQNNTRHPVVKLLVL